MSGGIAYIYDTASKFDALCNKEMVSLEAVADEDADFLRSMIERHHQYTGSKVAEFVLSDFENQLPHFIKVYPTDYKKVMEAVKRQVKSER